MIAGIVMAVLTAATVSVSPPSASPTQPTTFTLNGSGFQSIQGGFGGIYLLFGTVHGSWQPSRGGSGSYLYVPDSQTEDNAGYEKFIAFPGSSTASDANGGTLAANGTWSTTLKVPGATFAAQDGTQVNCLNQQCGFITIGAHGVANANNETFTAVTFGAGATSSTAPPPTASSSTTPRGAGLPAVTTNTPKPSASPKPAPKPTP
ncbi:MAG TPA: hypothetical protein VGL26_08240, partial [Jatrophihabitans sp.]